MNAAEAELYGFFSASVLERRLGLPAGFIRNYLDNPQAPHTSSWHDMTDYYRESAVKEFVESSEGQEAIQDYREQKKAEVQPLQRKDNFRRRTP